MLSWHYRWYNLCSLSQPVLYSPKKSLTISSVFFHNRVEDTLHFLNLLQPEQQRLCKSNLCWCMEFFCPHCKTLVLPFLNVTKFLLAHQ